MEANTQRHQLARCLLALHKGQVDPLATTAEAGDFCHRSAQITTPHSLQLTKRDHTDYFIDCWSEVMEQVRTDKHTLFESLAKGPYQCQAIMLFPTKEGQSRWLQEFHKQHGETVIGVRSSALHNVLKFRSDSKLLNWQLKERG